MSATAGLTYEHFFYAPDKAHGDALAAALQQRGAIVPDGPELSYRAVEAHLANRHRVDPDSIVTPAGWTPQGVLTAHGCPCPLPDGEQSLVAYTDYLLAPEQEEEWLALCEGFRTLAAELGCVCDGGGSWIGPLSDDDSPEE